jgi:hypothetical protein
LTIYTPSTIFPNNESVDFSEDQIFRTKINGRQVTDYQIIIRKISDNSLVYDSNKISLTTVLYDKEIILHTITADVIAFKGELKWVVTTWNGTENTTSKETPFYSFSLPALSLNVPSVINQKKYEFLINYNQSEDIPVNKYKFIWYSENDEVIEDTDYIYSGSLRHIFDGFISGETYKIEGMIETIYGVIVSTGKQTFTATYLSPSLVIKPNVEYLSDKSAIKMTWKKPNSVIGFVNGTYEYSDDFIVNENKGLKLNENSFEYYDNLNIEEDFIATIVYKPNAEFTNGKMVELDDNNYIVGYEDGRFYFKKHSDDLIGYGELGYGELTYGGIEDIQVYGIPMNLPTEPFLICLRSQDVIIIQNNEILEYLKV